MFINVKIRTAVAAILVLFSCALAACVTAGWWNARASAAAMEDVVALSDRQLQPLYDTERQLQLALGRMDNAYINLLRGDQVAANDYTRQASASVKEASRAFDRYLAAVRDDPALVQRSAALVRAHTDYVRVLGLREEALYDVSLDQYAAAATSAERADLAFEATLRELIRHAETVREDLRNASMQRYAGVNRLAMAMGVFSALLAAACWTFFRRVLLLPLKTAQRHFERIATGDLSTPIDGGGKSEIGLLLGALRDMQQGLAGTVETIRRASDDVDASVQHIAEGNQKLSSRNETQAMALEQTASTLQQLAIAVKQNANDTQTADVRVSATARDAGEGAAKVADIVVTMDSVAASGRRIGEIAVLIDGLAFQTNLLALNAAVEAARAGAHGRGFAVVAGEVRALALRSAEAAGQVKKLVEQSTTSIALGVARVGEARESMEQIVNSVNGVMLTMQRIAQATAEQSEGLEQVSKSVAQIDQTTQQNAGLVERTTETASHLTLQAARLVGAVSTFRTS